MPPTVANVSSLVKKFSLKFEDCVEILTYSACDAGKHPHVHLQDIAEGHQADQHLAQNYQARPNHSMWKQDSDAVNSLQCALNTKAGEAALAYLGANGNNSRAVLFSRSGAYWVNGEMQERHGPGAQQSGPGYYTEAKAKWSVTVLQNIAGNLGVVTHYPCAGGGNHTPPEGQDSVEAPAHTFTQFYSTSSWSGTAVQTVRWFSSFAP